MSVIYSFVWITNQEISMVIQFTSSSVATWLMYRGYFNPSYPQDQKRRETVYRYFFPILGNDNDQIG